MSRRQLALPPPDLVAGPVADDPPPYAAHARAAYARIRQPGLERIAVNVLTHVLADPLSSLITRTHVRAVLVPARGGQVLPIVVTVDYDMVVRPPIPRVIQEHLEPYMGGPALHVDLQVLCGDQEIQVRVFRQDRVNAPVNRAVHQDRHPQAAWRGDLIVMGRGPLFFYDHISPRAGPYIIRALEIAGECCVRAGVRPAA